MAGFLEDVVIEDVVPPLLLIAAVGVVGFIGYKYITSKFGGPGQTQAGASGDVTKNTSILDAIVNDTVTIGPGTETYTAAAGQVLTHPIDSIKSILGF